MKSQILIWVTLYLILAFIDFFCFSFSYFYPIFGLCIAIICVGGKIAISIEKRNAKRSPLLTIALPLVNNPQPEQSNNRQNPQVPLPINEMGQIEGPSISQANRSRWNTHLCSVTSYVLLIVFVFFPTLVASSSKTFLNFIVSGEMFNAFASLNDQEKMQLKDNFFAVLTNFIYPIIIYTKNKKLRNHVLECLNLK